MPDTMKLNIVSPYGSLYEDEAVQVTIPTGAGEVTILPEHMPLVSVLVPGELTIKKPNGDSSVLAVSSGILEVKQDSTVYVMADTAEHATDIDVERAEKAKKRAEELLKEKHNLEDVDFARIQASIEKELARLGVAKQYKK